MAILRFKNKTIFALEESTYGTDAGVAGANQVETVNLSINPYAGPTVEKMIDRATLGAYEQINTAPQVEVSFDCYLTGSGGSGTDTPPNFSNLLEAAGFDETVSASTQVEYAPASGTVKSCSIFFEHDGNQHKVLGARGNVSLTMNAGELPRLSFSFIGRYATPTTATTSTPSYANLGSCVPVTNSNTTTFTLGAQTEALVGFTLSMNNVIAMENIPNLNEAIYSDRAPSGSVTFLERAIADYDWYSQVESHSSVTNVVLAIVHSTTPNRVEVDAPKLQLSNPQKGERNGNTTMSFDVVALPNSGNDEFTITTL